MSKTDTNGDLKKRHRKQAKAIARAVLAALIRAATERHAEEAAPELAAEDLPETSPASAAATTEAADLPADDTAAAQADRRAQSRRRGLLALGVAVCVGLIVWLGYVWLGADSETTDDAYVAGNVVPITARESGTVIAIHADNAQAVKAGDTLVELDPSLVDAQMDAAQAALAHAVRQVHADVARTHSSGGEVAEAQAALATARGDYARRKAASASGAVPAEDLAHASDQLRHAEAALAMAQGHQAEALAAVSGADVAHNPAVLSAIAEIRRAAIAQGHMKIIAPVDGVVAERGVQIGEQVAGGVPLMAVVPLRDVWVDANFRETQLGDLRIGQPVTITTDAWGSSVTFHGHVIGISAGSGSAFALLPPQNASGNWIKVVQRLPVRIALDPKELAEHPLRIGLSVAVSVDTSDHANAAQAAPPAQLVGQLPPPPGAAAIDRRIAEIIAANGGAR